MFHLLRLNTAFALLFSTILIWLSEIDSIRSDLKMNTLFAMMQQYWFLTATLFLMCESTATFRAVTAGIIGGKTWGYLPCAYGLPFVNLGITIYLYGDDYGTDPRTFIGWNNETKMVFFYGILPTAGVREKSMLVALILVPRLQNAASIIVIFSSQ